VRLSRFVSDGLHEDVDVTNFTQQPASLTLELFLDGDFAGTLTERELPQAWSASAVWCLLQALLGLYPYAPLNLRRVDPRLPAWLPEITISNLHVGAAVVDVRFHRTADGHSDYEVLDKRGPLHVVRQPSPWSLTATFGERLHDALSSLVPGR
jgi:hypothetical protein